MMRPPLFLAALLALAACQRGPELSTRTFALHRLKPNDARGLVAPYVYQDRRGAPGMITASEHAITVREVPENLDRIGAVLAQHDALPTTVLLRFQLIRADGVGPSDSAIAPLEAQLRPILRYGGYHLAASALLRVAAGEFFREQLPQVEYALTGQVEDVQQTAAGAVATVDVDLRSLSMAQSFLMTTVTVRDGQTIVLGTAGPMPDRGQPLPRSPEPPGALILALTADLSSAPGPAPAR